MYHCSCTGRMLMKERSGYFYYLHPLFIGILCFIVLFNDIVEIFYSLQVPKWSESMNEFYQIIPIGNFLVGIPHCQRATHWANLRESPLEAARWMGKNRVNFRSRNESEGNRRRKKRKKCFLNFGFAGAMPSMPVALSYHEMFAVSMASPALWRCRACGKQVTNRWHHFHIHNRHRSLCPYCPATYSRIDTLRTHIKTKHGELYYAKGLL